MLHLGILEWPIVLALGLYSLAVIAHFVLSLVKPAANKWTELLNTIVEPVLQPIRKLLTSMFNASFDKFDWSHFVLLALLQITTSIISFIL